MEPNFQQKFSENWTYFNLIEFWGKFSLKLGELNSNPNIGFVKMG